MGTSASKPNENPKQNSSTPNDTEFQRHTTTNRSFKEILRRSLRRKKNGRDVGGVECTEDFNYVISNQSSSNVTRDLQQISTGLQTGSNISRTATPNTSPYNTTSRQSTPLGTPLNSRNSSLRHNQPAPPIYQNQVEFRHRVNSSDGSGSTFLHPKTSAGVPTQTGESHCGILLVE